MANADIPVGTPLVIERPTLSFTLHPDKFGFNCQHCFKVVKRVVPCPRCIWVCFCSKDCRDKALGSYHKYGFSLYHTIWYSCAQSLWRDCEMSTWVLSTHRSCISLLPFMKRYKTGSFYKARILRCILRVVLPASAYSCSLSKTITVKQVVKHGEGRS